MGQGKGGRIERVKGNYRGSSISHESYSVPCVAVEAMIVIILG